jgi:hypothetical protein
LSAGGKARFGLRVPPDKQHETALELWFDRRLADGEQLVVRLWKPGSSTQGGDLWVSLPGSHWLSDGSGKVIAGVMALNRVPQSTTKAMALVMVAATQMSTRHPEAPAGEWQLEVEVTGLSHPPLALDLWVERDDTVVGASRGQQARLRVLSGGGLTDEATFTHVAHGARPFVVTALRARDQAGTTAAARPSVYSSAGRAHNPQRCADFSALVDPLRWAHGMRVMGNHSGVMVRANGTSLAAPAGGAVAGEPAGRRQVADVGARANRGQRTDRAGGKGRAMTRSTARITLRQLSQLGLPAPLVLPSLLPVLREVVRADHAAFFFCDAGGNITNLYAERLLPPDVQARYHDKHNDAQFRRHYLARVAAASAVSRRSVSDAERQLDYYREVLKPLEVEHFLYAIVRAGSRVIGQLSLYRGAGSGPFTDSDAEHLLEVLHYLGAALATPSPSVEAATLAQSAEEGLAVFDSFGQVLFADAAWGRLVRMAEGNAITPAHGAARNAFAATFCRRDAGGGRGVAERGAPYRNRLGQLCLSTAPAGGRPGPAGAGPDRFPPVR